MTAKIDCDLAQQLLTVRKLWLEYRLLKHVVSAPRSKVKVTRAHNVYS